MNYRNTKIWLLAILIFFLILTCIKPVFPDEIILQHTATFIMITLLTVIIIKNNISNQAFFCFILMTSIHIVGARWNYSYTPYDKWIQTIFGFSIDKYFNFKRNQYDRFVHFMYGFLMVIPFSEIYRNWFHIPGKMSKHIAFLFILATSLIYELLEWVVALILSPEQANAYNGQQGDFWDAQKDMGMAMFGALIMILILRIWRKIKDERNQVKV
jgi:putative membrane protein